MPSAEHIRLLNLATRTAVAVALTLIVAKTVAYLMTDSVALLSTLIDSLLDAAASLINLFAVRHALVPADSDHRFGHGKAEPLAGLAQAGFIAGSAVFLAFEAGGRLIEPQAVSHIDIGVSVMILSLVLTTALILLQRYVIARTSSVAIEADSLHYLGDILVNGSVLVALLVQQTADLPLLDPILGFVIAIYILRTAWKIGQRSLGQLMDQELPETERERIVALTLQEPGVLGLHDLRTRKSGPDLFIQLHLDLDGGLALREAHAIAERVEKAILGEFPHAGIIIHEDPTDALATVPIGQPTGQPTGQ